LDTVSSAERADLLRFARRLVGDCARADDIVQETLLRAHRARAGFKGGARLGTWLAAIALNVVRDQARRQAARPDEVADDDALDALAAPGDAEHALLEREMGACITAHLMALPERQRQVLALHDMGGAGHAEIAEVLGISEANARVVLHRARAALRQRLSRHCQLSFGTDAIPCTPKDEGIG
jgi:RNA polymerase sigma-70 factor (ECF subfamily)